MLQDGPRGWKIVIERLSDRKNSELEIGKDGSRLREGVLIPFERSHRTAGCPGSRQHPEYERRGGQASRKHQGVQPPVLSRTLHRKWPRPHHVREEENPCQADRIFLGLDRESEEGQDDK